MYIVYFEGVSMGQRFDDPEEMGKAIAQFLDRCPQKKILRVEKYI